MSQLALVLRTHRRYPTPPPGSSDEFFTPTAVYAPLHAEMGFTLDPCATAESAKCKRYYTKAEDGLAQPWGGERVWLNPPYSNIGPWVEKAHREVALRGAKLVCALLPAWTDRAWWMEHVEPWRDRVRSSRLFTLETRFLRGRIRFGWPGNPEGTGQRGGGTFPSVLVIWRART